MPRAVFIRWLESYQQAKEPAVKIGILDLFDRVKNISSTTDEGLLTGLDFDPNDTALEKLESLIAELRAAVFLHETGFTDIKLIPKMKKKKSYDISTKFGNENFIVEVACLTKTHSRKKLTGVDAYLLDTDKFKATLKDIAEKKKNQLNINGASYRALLIFVLNRSPEVELYNFAEYRKFIESLYSQLAWGQGYYLGFVTGTENFIYPTIQFLNEPACSS